MTNRTAAEIAEEAFEAHPSINTVWVDEVLQKCRSYKFEQGVLFTRPDIKPEEKKKEIDYESEIRYIAGVAWKGAANAYRMYPDNNHTFADYWQSSKFQFDEFLAKFKKEQAAQTALIELQGKEIEGLRNTSIIELEKERMEWALQIFPLATAQSSLNKLREEIKEIESDILNGKIEVEEYVDALMCLFDSAGRQGILPADIFDAFRHKLAKNKARIWVKNPDNTYSHVKGQTID